MTTVETTGGTVRGLDHGDHLAFLGVPFADPPYPDHPFDPPRRLRGWAGVRDATAHGASVAHADVAQHLFPDPVVTGADCLHLTVHAPPPSGDLHPVLVWLYGGGYFSGTNASPWYSGEAFARSGVVLVVPNHRVDAEGFAVLDDGVANRALLDVAPGALRWAPSVDGATVTATAAQALADGRGPEALMIGTTTQEWNFLVGPVEPAPSREACVEGLSTLGLTDDDLRGYLAALRTDNPGHAVAQALTDEVFRVPARRLADTATAAGVPTFAYQFAWPAPGLGAHHCADLRFVFDHLDLPGPGDGGLRAAGAPQHLATTMHDALVRFARDGEPGWGPYRLDDRGTMAFSENPRVVTEGFTRAPHDLA